MMTLKVALIKRKADIIVMRAWNILIEATDVVRYHMTNIKTPNLSLLTNFTHFVVKELISSRLWTQLLNWSFLNNEWPSSRQLNIGILKYFFFKLSSVGSSLFYSSTSTRGLFWYWDLWTSWGLFMWSPLERLHSILSNIQIVDFLIL